MDNNTDWDYMDSYYSEEGNKVKSLEEYILETDESDMQLGSTLLDVDKDLLTTTINDVKIIRSLLAEGITVAEMAERTGKPEDYVRDIAIVLNSTTEEEDDIAVAHLILM